MQSNRTYGELEVRLSRAQSGAYEIELRLNDPASDAVLPPEKGYTGISPETLRAIDLSDYSDALTRQLFLDGGIRSFYGKAKAAFESSGRMLRFQLAIGSSAPELHGLRWELLKDPDTGAILATSERILFSRFMLSGDWRAVKLQAKGELKAVIAVSAPSDLANYEMAPIDSDGEIGRAREGLSGIQTTVIGQKKPLTLQCLIDSLRLGIDVLYLVCHGIVPKNLEPVLFLQDVEGKAAAVKASDFALRIAELAHAPRLIVLASCESADSETSKAALASLAPQLAHAGVPAILAMQGKISMETVKLMMPVFFRELLLDGQIDRAMAVARGCVRHRRDSWVPALFLRLRSGRIWYVPGFASEKGGFEQWESICRFIRDGEFVPIIGPDFAEHIYGPTRMLAYELAADTGFPLSPNDQSDPAKVAQYIATKSSPKDVRGLFRDALFRKLQQRAKTLGCGVDETASPPQLMARVVADLSKDKDEPFSILSGLKPKVYITANADPLLEMFVQQAGNSPTELVSRWRDERRETQGARAAASEPSPEKPLIYYAYGKSKYEDTWVLTEDDFFDYLIRTSKYDLMPLVVSNALTAGSLLFLGFSLDDWKFRILFRMILAKGGSALIEDCNHVGVQVNPDEHTLADVERAKKYLERYFTKCRIDIYWGSAKDFLNELRDKLLASLPAGVGNW